VKITVFQALTLLAKKYKDDQENQAIYQQVKHLYLSGVRTDQDQAVLAELLKNDALKDHEITDRKEDINEDPARRYFESQLCLETLSNSLDELDLGLLKNNLKKVHLGKLNSENYNDEIKYLKEKESFQFLKPNQEKDNKTPTQLLKARKNKLLLLQDCIYSSIAIVNSRTREYPLNLYPVREYVYDPKNRGREEKEGQTVKTHNLGITRSYTPLPINDDLLALLRICRN